MNNFKEYFKKLIIIRRRILWEIEHNHFKSKDLERLGFKKAKAQEDKLYKEWQKLRGDLQELDTIIDSAQAKAKDEGLTSKEITRLSYQAYDELDLEEKQG
jgi:hypothetical protein